MGRKEAFTLQTLILSLLFNGLLLACIYWVGKQMLLGMHDGVALLGGSGLEGVPGPFSAAVKGVSALIDQSRRYLAPLVFGLGGLTTLALWISVRLAGRRLLGEEGDSAGEAVGHADDFLKGEVKRLEKELQSAKKAAARPSPAPAIQILSILQRQGRLIDFLREDLGPYEDSQIGAAVRSVHQGCREALSQNLELEAVLREEEGSEVTIQPGFDAEAVRLTGDVKGDPPFRGILRHRGWRVVRMDLPLKSPDREKDWILAPAEVEMGE